jgi:DNA-binding response OmpR family regulator
MVNVNPHRILVVEDQPDTFAALRLLLKHYCYAVDIAPTLAEAKRMLATPVSLVCLDLNLPDGDGATLLAELRGRATTPVVVCTGCSDMSRLRRVRNLMPDLLLQKPVDFLHLLQEIRRIIEGPREPHRPAGVTPEARMPALF